MKEPSLTGRPEPGKPVHTVTSAGGVILDAEDRVLLLRRKQEGTWVLPKGRVESGETLQQTALREVEEETGLKNVRIMKEIGLVRYIFFWRPDNVNYKKTVHYFLMRLSTCQNELTMEPDFSEYAWQTADIAAKQLTFENDRKIVRSIVN